jgi:Tfp pilus assembly protein PilO
MKELFNFLNVKERRIAASLALLFVASLCVFLFVSLREKHAAGHTAARLQASEKDYRELSRTRSETKREWQLWQDARKDMEVLKETYFYAQEKGFEDLRLDVQKIFDASGVAVSEITFGYADFLKGNIQKVNADFHFSGSYASLKRFLDIVERHPRFIAVEKIDFLDIGTQPGLLELRIFMAGYYER